MQRDSRDRQKEEMRRKQAVSTTADCDKRLLQPETKRILGDFIKPADLVGEAYSLAYEYSRVLLLDSFRAVNCHLPENCTLLGSRFDPQRETNYDDEDATFVLLTVKEEVHPDAWTRLDPVTADHPAIVGVECEVLGTFYLRRSNKRGGLLKLSFGTVADFNPEQHFHVYKPDAEVVVQIVHTLGEAVVDALLREMPGSNSARGVRS